MKATSVGFAAATVIGVAYCFYLGFGYRMSSAGVAEKDCALRQVEWMRDNVSHPKDPINVKFYTDRDATVYGSALRACANNENMEIAKPINFGVIERSQSLEIQAKIGQLLSSGKS